MRKTGKYINCPMCNKSFYAPSYRLRDARNAYCSQECHYKHAFMLTIENIAKPYSMTLKNLICQLYFKEQKSMRKITKKLKINYRTTQKLFKAFNISQRSVHDRIALQWKDNEKRRKEQGERSKKLLTGRPSWNKGLTQKIHLGIKRQAEWMIGVNNPMYGKRGKAHHAYKNGKYTAEKKRFWGTSEYQQWRKAVYERDDYTCQECSDDKGGSLNAHHIKSCKDYPELIYVISNGITLCETCHQFVHYSMKADIEHRHETCRGGASISV